MNEDSEISFDRFRRLGFVALFIGIVCLIVWAVGYMGEGGDHRQAMLGYLFGFVFWGSMTIGCFGLLLLHGSLKAKWGTAISRLVEAGGGPVMLVALFILLLPIAIPGIGLNAIYQWTNRTFMESDPTLKQKLFYLTPSGFFDRAIIIIAIWIFFSFLLTRSSRRQDETKKIQEWWLRSNWGSPGIVMFFITITLLSTDWVMSLEPKYFSTIYGIIFGVGCALGAMSLCVMIILFSSDKPPFRAIVTPQLTKDFGNVLLTLTMLWCYTTLAQFLITWEGNLPLEAPYYIVRTGNGLLSGQNHMDWNILSNLVILFQFFVPFFALIAPRTKRVRRNLIWTCAIIFVTLIFTTYWYIFPDARPGQGFGASLGHWTDYAAFFGIGGIWFFIFTWQLVKFPLLPKYDTRLMEAEHA